MSVTPASVTQRVGPFRRRRLLGLLAFGSGLAVERAASLLSGQSVQAANGDALTLGSSGNSSTGSTTVQAAVSGYPGLRVSNASSGPITTDDAADGIQGYASAANTAGVFGRNNTPDGAGVWGQAPNGTGTFGLSDKGSGVSGKSTSGAGLYGTSTSGVGAVGNSVSSWGIHGVSTSSFGIVGQSNAGHGIYGTSTSGTTAGVLGESAWVGVYGKHPSKGSYAGYFYGNVVVDGNFSVVNGSKAALVTGADGALRRLYCQESPEPWFEDFGKGTLVNGRATITLDADFLATVKTDDYGVFPVPEGDCNGLYVTAKTATSFDVRELKNGTSTLAFRYRVLAKRRDTEVGRLERMPSLPAVPQANVGPPPTPVPTATPGPGFPTPVASPSPASTAAPAPTR
ncbi:MAG: hypothetical protein U0821_08575 [Chloroflexota bacterium]